MSPLNADLKDDALLAALPLNEGRPLLGGVALEQRLGRGGMGAVYRGRHLRLGIDVAVKIMAPPATLPADHADSFVRRFVREAQSTAAVAHENLVRIYDVNSEHGIHFLVMDFIDGESAAEMLKRTGPLAEEEAARIVLGAAQGLAEAHRKGIVHRDVKPDNIMIDREGRVRVTDLGLAKSFADDPDGETALTQAGMAMGTPAYMPPEQFYSAHDVGPQADVWSLGVTLYRLLTGKAPWSGTTPYDLARKIESDPLPDVRQLRPELSPGLWSVLVTCLQKDPAERYRDCGEMAAALREALRAQPPPEALRARPPEAVVASRAAVARAGIDAAPTELRPSRSARSSGEPGRPSWTTTILLQFLGLGLFYLRPKSGWRFVNALLLPSLPLIVALGLMADIPLSMTILLAPLLLHALASIRVLLLCHEDRSGARTGGWRAVTWVASCAVLVQPLSFAALVNSHSGPDFVLDEPSFSPEEVARALTEQGWYALSDGGTEAITCVAFSPDGRWLATANGAASYAYWDLTTGERAGSFGEDYPPSVITDRAVAFAPDGAHLATARADNTVALWELSTGSKQRSFRGHKDSVTAVAFSADGRFFATASEDRTAALWDAATGERLRQFRDDFGFYAVAFSPDSRLLVTGSISAYVWDVATGEKLRSMDIAEGVALDAAFSPDGKLLATASNNETAAIWSVETGEKLQTLEGHAASVSAVAFSPDGRYLATGSSDQTAALWDVSTGKRLNWLEGHSDGVTSVAFSPDGRLLATGSRDQTVRLWRVGAFVGE